jgi:hypothetical protein
MYLTIVDAVKKDVSWEWTSSDWDFARVTKMSMLSITNPFALPRGAWRMVWMMLPRRVKKGDVGEAGLVVLRVGGAW